MTCGNGMCFDYDHLTTSKTRSRYSPMRSEYIIRFSPQQIRTANYFIYYYVFRFVQVNPAPFYPYQIYCLV
jgi:hypothetical protein